MGSPVLRVNVNAAGSLSDRCDLSVFIYCGDCLVIRGVAVSGGVVLSEELLSLDLRNGIRPDPGGRPGLQCVTVLLLAFVKPLVLPWPPVTWAIMVAPILVYWPSTFR